MSRSSRTRRRVRPGPMPCPVRCPPARAPRPRRTRRLPSAPRRRRSGRASDQCRGSSTSATIRDVETVTTDELASARAAIAAAGRVVVLTGAGISTDSGIPDFRGPNGVWTRNPAAEKASNIQHYLRDPEVRRAAWQTRVDGRLFAAEPNRGHRAIVELQHQGKLLAVVTQNVDGLHQRAGTDPDKVIEVHGTAHWTRCWECGDRRPMTETLARVRAGEEDPPCLVCGGIL